MTEELIIDKSIKGDTLAFGQLVDKYSAYLFAIVFRLVNSEEEAEDIVQEVFIQVWQKLKEYDPHKAKFSTWLYTIATRLAIDALRKKKLHVELCDDYLPLQMPDVHGQLSNKETARLIYCATKKLSPLQKAVFVLREVEGLGVNEVMLITGLTAKQIKDNLYWARKLIKERLAKYIIE